MGHPLTLLFLAIVVIFTILFQLTVYAIGLYILEEATETNKQTKNMLTASSWSHVQLVTDN